MLPKLLTTLVVVFLCLSQTAFAAIYPGDRLERDGRYIGSTGFCVEYEGNTYMIVTAHQALGWDAWVANENPEGTVYSVGGVEIGEFYSWGPYKQYGPGTDVMAILLYPHVEVSNEIDGIIPLGFIYQEFGNTVIGRGRGGTPVYGESFGTDINQRRANARLPGVQPGYSGSAILYVNPPAITGVIHGGSGDLALAVSGKYALQVLGLEGAHLVGGLPDRVIAFGSMVIPIDYLFDHRAESGAKINDAITAGYDYAVFNIDNTIIPIWRD